VKSKSTQRERTEVNQDKLKSVTPDLA